MTTKKLEHLGTEKLSEEVSTSKNDLLNELNIITNKMIVLLIERKTKKEEDIIYFNNLGSLAQSHIISPLYYLCELSRFLTEKEWDCVSDFILLHSKFGNFIENFVATCKEVNEILDNNLQYKENKNGNN